MTVRCRMFVFGKNARGVAMAAAVVAAGAASDGGETGTVVKASAGHPLRFAGCRAEVSGVYTQADVRVAVLDGVDDRRAGPAATVLPEPGVDRSGGGGVAAAMVAAPAPVLPAVAPEEEDVRSDRTVGRQGDGAGAGRDARGVRDGRRSAQAGRWGWLDDSVRRSREQQGRERLTRPPAALPGLSSPFGSDSLLQPGSAFDAAPFAPDESVAPIAPRAPSPYRSDASER